MYNHTWTFRMNYGIRIEVLILAVQALLPTEQSPQPKDNFLGSIMALYANVKSTSIKDFSYLIVSDESSKILSPIQR